MTTPGWHDWPLWAIAASLALLGCAALAWGILYDRPRGRRRCPRCWYDMAGVPGLTCPECGRSARHERRLRRTRHSRPLLALGALLLLASCAPTRIKEVQRRGWPAALPDPVLMAVMPLGARDASWQKSHSGFGLGYDLHHEIRARLGFRYTHDTPTAEHRLGPIDRRVLAWLCLRLGDPERLEWNQDFYGAVLASLAAAGALPDSAWPTIYYRTANTAVWCRDRWPKDIPIRVAVHTPAWFHLTPIDRRGAAPQRRATFERPGVEGAAISRLMTPSPGLLKIIGCEVSPLTWDDNTIELGPGADPLRLLVTLDEQAPDGAWRPLWDGTARIPTTLVPTIDDAITIVRDPAIDAALARAMHIVVQGGHAHLWMTATPEIDTSTLTLGLRIRFLRRGEEVAHADAWTRAWVETPAPQPVAMGIPIEGDTAALLATDLANDPDWTIEITADPTMALRDFRSDRCWGGTFTLPREQATVRDDDSIEARMQPPPRTVPAG